MSDTPSGPPRPPEHEEEGRWRTALGDAGPYLGLGFQIAVTVALYVGVGLGLDFWLGTLPWLTILGALAGMGTALYQVTRAAEEMGRNDSERRARRGGAQSNDEERPKQP